MLMMLSRVFPGFAWRPRPNRASMSSGSPWAASKSPWLSRRVSRSWTSLSKSLTSSRPTSSTRVVSCSPMKLEERFHGHRVLGVLLAQQVDRPAENRQQ